MFAHFVPLDKHTDTEEVVILTDQWFMVPGGSLTRSQRLAKNPYHAQRYEKSRKARIYF